MIEVASVLVSILSAGLATKRRRALPEDSDQRLKDAKRLRAHLEARLSEFPYATTALARLEDDPENPRRQAALEDAIDEAVREDPEFRRFIEQQVEELLGEDATGPVSIRGQEISIGPVKGSVWRGRLPGDSDEEF